MKFHSTQDLSKRLMRTDRLTREEMDEAAGHVQFLLSDALHRYFAELLSVVADDLVSLRATMQENLKAIKSFDQASRKLAGWLIGLTVVLVVLTIVIAWFTIVLVLRK
jgi:uncharacterized membrane protein